VNYLVIDCGATATRLYFVEHNELKYSHKGEKGVLNISSRTELKEYLARLFQEALEKYRIDKNEVAFAVAAGMITAEVGLKEVPHMIAPAGEKELYEGLDKLTDEENPLPILFYLVRGIKNSTSVLSFKDIDKADLMRGEEVQAMGVKALFPELNKSFNILQLGSTTKFIPIDEKGRIGGSCTSLSGQTYGAVMSQTLLKSSGKVPGVIKPDGFYSEEIVEHAVKCLNKNGLLRSLMLIRFSQILTEHTWYERGLFMSALFAADDTKWLMSLKEDKGWDLSLPMVFIGEEQRCRLYEQLCRKMGIGQAYHICDIDEIDSLAIKGTIRIMKQ
jgi:2-dehydro-3-deoxygalactonokinase